MPTLELGRELDALVAEKVMGMRVYRQWPDAEYDSWRMVPTAPGTVEEWDHEDLATYSTDIAAAWRVVERLQDLGCNHFSLEWEQPYDDQPRREREANPQERPWLFAFNAPRHLSGSPSIGMPHPVVLHAPTAPLAICYGALIAVGAAYPLGTDVRVPDKLMDPLQP